MNKLVYAFSFLIVLLFSHINCQEKILNKIKYTIDHLDDLESFKQENFNKTKLLELVDQLQKESYVELFGEDSEIRPLLVSLQALFEEVLSEQLKKTVSLLAGIIIGDTPPTPLYFSDNLSQNSLPPTIISHTPSLSTIKIRSKILNEYLQRGGILYALYTRNGYNSLNVNEKEEYQKIIAKYSTNLISRELTTEKIPSDLIGAIYYFSNNDLKTYAFAIEMPQASNPNKKSSFKLYCGEITNSIIEERMNQIMQFINTNET